MMKELLSSMLFTTILFCNLYAESNKADDEWLKEMQILENKIKDEKNKQDIAKAKTIEAKKKNEELKNLNKTLDEALDLVNTKK